jgi:hypothetical protein
VEAEARASCSFEVTRDGDIRVSFGPAAGVECATDARGGETERKGGRGKAPLATRAGQRKRRLELPESPIVLASQLSNACVQDQACQPHALHARLAVAVARHSGKWWGG